MSKKIFLKLLWFLPKKISHKIIFRIKMGKKLDYNNLKGINEKIHYMIVNKYGIKEAKLTDKYLVKEYIQNLGIKDLYVPKTYFLVDEKNYDKNNFPDSFVLKCNHGSGDVFICNDKNNFDIDEAIKKLSKLKKNNYAKRGLEYHYSYIKPEIMCEEYLKELGNDRPIDYKFFCYNGYVDCVMVCTDRSNGNYRDFYDKDWNYLDYSITSRRSPEKIKKPKNIERMFEIASILSKDFPFVRVDLYNLNGKIYFSELTFTPAAGLAHHYNEKCDKHLGEMLNINNL